MPDLSIGDLAKRTGLPVKLIRHWSDLGLVPPTERTGTGHRRYAPGAVARLDLARTLRDLGLGLAAIRAVLDREHDLAAAARLHADAIEVQIRTLRLQQAVLRSVADRGAGGAQVAVLTWLARLSAAERDALIHDFVTRTVGDLDLPTYRDGLLAATPDLPADPTPAQLDAWLELAELVRTPELGAAMRRMAEYAAAQAPGPHDDAELRAVEELTDRWAARVRAAMTAGIAPDSPAADPVVAEIVAMWQPSQHGAAGDRDSGAARDRLREQLAVAADAGVERYWQLVCTINGWPVRPSLAGEGDWLATALAANPAPGALAAEIGSRLADPEPAGLVDACARVLADVETLVAAVNPDRFADPTPCGDWDVRALLDHLVYENLMWTSLAAGNPRADFAADHLGDDHVAAFRSAANDTLVAFRTPGMTTRRYGPAPGWRLVEQVVLEMLVHGWDLARATGQPSDLAPDVATAMLPAARQLYGDLPRTAGGSFGPARSVPDGATAADRLAGYLGRDVG